MALTKNERIAKLNNQIRTEAGMAYGSARTINPAEKIGFTRHAISVLIIESKMTGEYPELKNLLNECIESCKNANLQYKQANWDGALYLCDQVLDDIGLLMHEGYALFNENTFKFTDIGAKGADT